MPSEPASTTESTEWADAPIKGQSGWLDRLRENSRTLQFRLTAWNTVVVAVTVALTLFGIHQAVRHFMLREFDNLLLEDIDEIRLTVKQLYPDWKRLHNELNRKAQGHVHHLWFVQFHDDQGKHLWTCDDAPEIEAPVDVTKRRKATLSDEPPFRLAQDRIDLPGVPPMILRVGSSREPLVRELELLSQIMVVGGVVSLLLAPVGGYWLAGRAIQPVARIIATTAKLQPSNMAERLPIRHTGDELDQLSMTINGMLDRIASYLKQNRDFVANAAHELRSPLAAIHTSVEVALGEKRGVDDYVGLLGDVMEECASLERLVNRLLMLAETESGLGSRGDGAGVRLDLLVRKSIEMFRGVAEMQCVTLQARNLAEVLVRGDESYLRQVVQNLLDNAIKFTPAGGRVTIEVRLDSAKSQVELGVSDTGVGIAEADLPRVFERFYQADKSRQHGDGKRGTGLGLSICHAIVHALGGEIRVESQAGQGTNCIVLLPWVKQPEAAEATRTGNPDSWSSGGNAAAL